MNEHLEDATNLQQTIKEILLREWDPIGIQAIPEANSEYDAYVATLYKLIVSQKPSHEIESYLWWAETEHMGLIGDQQKTKFITKKLVPLLKK